MMSRARRYFGEIPLESHDVEDNLHAIKTNSTAKSFSKVLGRLHSIWTNPFCHLTMSKGISICVFRNDLRIQDNPLLNAALKTKRDLLPVYIWDPRQYNLSPLNIALGSNFTPPKTWHFKFDRCLAPRMRYALWLTR